MKIRVSTFFCQFCNFPFAVNSDCTDDVFQQVLKAPGDQESKLRDWNGNGAMENLLCFEEERKSLNHLADVNLKVY